jgi:hypothetical protein
MHHAMIVKLPKARVNKKGRWDKGPRAIRVCTWWTHALESKQCEDDFQGKWSPIHKVTIKQIWILFRGKPIQLKNV